MIVHSYYPWDVRVKKEVEALVERHKVDVICLRNDVEGKKEKIGNVTIYRVSVKRKHGGALRYVYEYFLFFIISFCKLNLLYLKKRYKVIHIHTLPDFLVFTAFFPKLCGARIILDMHEAMPEIFAVKFNKELNSKLILFIKFIEKISTDFAHNLITVSPAVKDTYINRGILSEKINLILNVPNKRIFCKDQNNIERPDSLKNKFILIQASAIFRERDLETVIKAINILKEDIPNIFLLLFGEALPGDEDYELILKNLVNDLNLENNIHFGKWIPPEDVAKFISISDVGLLSNLSNYSTELALSNRLFEYIALEKPMVISRTKAIFEFIGENSAMYFEPENEKDLAMCILELYKNPNKSEKMIDNAKEIYSKYDWEIMKNNLFKLYEREL